MTSKTFVRVTRGSYAGMTGEIVAPSIGDESRFWVRMTATGEHLLIAGQLLQVEYRTSELRERRAA